MHLYMFRMLGPVTSLAALRVSAVDTRYQPCSSTFSAVNTRHQLAAVHISAVDTRHQVGSSTSPAVDKSSASSSTCFGC